MSSEGPSALGLLAAEFGDYQVSLRPCGLDIVSAYWQSGDGLHRRYVVAASAGDLLTRLRTIRQEEDARHA